jgi:hypothetical protein
MLISRQLDVHRWDSHAAAVARDYWEQRGFTNAAVNADLEIIGTRGSWLGNLTSYNMSKLRASIRMSPVGAERIALELDVNTWGQQITQWNHAYWRLEIIEVQRLLRGDGDLSDLWQRFKDDSRRASILWTFTVMLGGQRLSDVWNDTISNLE